jgi:cytochrome c553
MIRTAAMAILLATSFMSHAAEEAKAKADPAKGKAIAETVCVACHGADGNSAASANPHLAAQHQEYIYKQLKNFKAVDGGATVRRRHAQRSCLVRQPEAETGSRQG